MGGNPWIPTHFIYPSNIPQHLAIPPAKKCLPSAECTPPHIERASPFGLQYAKQRKLRSRSSDCPAAYRSGDKDSPHKKNRPFCCSAPLYCHNAAPNTHPATEKWKDGSLPAAAAAPLHRVTTGAGQNKENSCAHEGAARISSMGGKRPKAPSHWVAAPGTSPLPAASYTGSAENGYSQKTPHTFPCAAPSYRRIPGR